MYRACKISRGGFLGKFRPDFSINLSHLSTLEQFDSTHWRILIATACGDARRQLRPPICCAMGSLTAGVTGPVGRRIEGSNLLFLVTNHSTAPNHPHTKPRTRHGKMAKFAYRPIGIIALVFLMVSELQASSLATGLNHATFTGRGVVQFSTVF